MAMTKEEISVLSEIKTDVGYLKENMITKEGASLLLGKAIGSHLKENHKGVSWSLLGKILAATALVGAAVFSFL